MDEFIKDIEEKTENANNAVKDNSVTTEENTAGGCVNNDNAYEEEFLYDEEYLQAQNREENKEEACDEEPIDKEFINNEDLVSDLVEAEEEFLYDEEYLQAQNREENKEEASDEEQDVVLDSVNNPEDVQEEKNLSVLQDSSCVNVDKTVELSETSDCIEEKVEASDLEEQTQIVADNSTGEEQTQSNSGIDASVIGSFVAVNNNGYVNQEQNPELSYQNANQNGQGLNQNGQQNVGRFAGGQPNYASCNNFYNQPNPYMQNGYVRTNNGMIPAWQYQEYLVREQQKMERKAFFRNRRREKLPLCMAILGLLTSVFFVGLVFSVLGLVYSAIDLKRHKGGNAEYSLKLSMVGIFLNLAIIGGLFVWFICYL